MSSFPIFAYMALFALTAILERSFAVRDARFYCPPQRDWSRLLIMIPAAAVFFMPLYEAMFTGTEASAVPMVIGALLWVLAIAVRAKANMDVRRALSTVPDPAAPMPLIHDGIYAQIRHPLFLGVLLLYVACPLFLGATYAWVFSFVGLLGLLARMRIEEIAMMIRNEAYVEYRKRTKALIPKVY